MNPDRIGPYPIEREVGRGGMGVVYLGRDTRLDRRVAIKVLPDAFAVDPERLARFEREARVVASLNHPNIAGIYGLEEAGGRRFLALEYVEGDTLAQRLARGPIPLDEALDLCRQVAAALEAAHEGGVVHRDLKPGNVKITPSGEVKVLDFGLAKGGAGSTSDSSSDLSHSPTMTQAATGVGVILGTAAYMSPEQARGKAVDKRADIWSFGCLLYECLTGRQAFSGETVSDMIARILQGEPEWNALPAGTPERIRGLLRRCLEKDVRRRLRDIGDAKIEIEDVLAVRASSSSLRVAAGGPRRAALGAARTVAIALAAAAVTWFLPRALQKPARHAPSRFEIPQPDGVFLDTDGQGSAISPDGRFLAFIATDSSGNSRLWVRPLESTVARPLAWTDKVDRGLFWSPDSRQIAFTSDGRLRKISVAGGDAEVVCPVLQARGGSWSRSGVILIAPNPNGRIYRVPASGGELQPVTTVDSTHGETAHRFPQFLPDGRHFVYSVLPARNGKFDIYVGSLDSPKRSPLVSAESGVTVGAPGHLLYSRGGKLVAQSFDERGLKLRGEPKSLGDLPAPTNFSGGAVASAARNGAIAFGTFRLANLRLAWIDHSGREVSRIPLAPGPYAFGSLSPDDRRAALSRFESADQVDIYLVDLERGVASRFTDEPGNNVAPMWSPDGSRIAYAWDAGTPQVLKVKTLGGDTPETLLQSDPMFKRFFDWTPDGKSFVYSRLDPSTQWDLWVLPMEGDHTPRPYLRTRFSESFALVSPDGRWVVYLSDKSGQFEAYVQSFPTPGGEYQVTTGGGQHAGWSPDGKQLYYFMNSDAFTILGADVLPGPEFRLGPPRVVMKFPKDMADGRPAHDGKRMLALIRAGKEPTQTITVVLDGLAGVR